VRWETERSLGGKLCQDYSYKKLSKSDNGYQVTVENVEDVFGILGCFFCFFLYQDNLGQK